MATTGATRPVAGGEPAGRRRRSLVFYAGVGLSAEMVFLAGAVALVLDGVGRVATTIALVTGVAIPMVTAIVLLRRTVVPLQAVVDTVLHLASGNHAARAQPGGPSEVGDLAASVNFLADESDRMRAELEERARLTTVIRETAVRIREHLSADGVIAEAMAAIRQNLECDFVDVGLVGEGGYTFLEQDPEDPLLRSTTVANLPPDHIALIEELYRERSSYVVQDLRCEERSFVPGPIREALLAFGAVSLLFTPCGSGSRLLGTLTLLRKDPGRPWTQAEIHAVESIASDLGRGLDHARLYAQEKEMVQQLKELDQAKSDFLAAVTHDLRAPLTSIIGYTEMLSDDEKHPLSGAQHQMLAAIDRNTSRLQTLIDDVLTMSRIELGNFETTRQPVDLAAVVRAVVEEIQVTAAEAGLELRLTSPGQALVVNGDPEQLDRALTNLLSNAVKYTPRGGQVDVSARRDADQALVAIRDTGIGIPDQDQPSLFTRFFRASNAVTRSFPGTGLGLAIARAIIDNHHGEVTLESREGAGTTVTVRLPLVPESPPDGGSVPAAVSQALPDCDPGAHDRTTPQEDSRLTSWQNPKPSASPSPKPTPAGSASEALWARRGSYVMTSPFAESR